jgi:ribosomal peptide maturation radical SAM protein 1
MATRRSTGGRTRSTRPSGLRVALVSMPLGALERPSLGLGLLQAEAEAAGHRCTSHFFGFDFADTIGLADYQWLANVLPYTMFAGDWLFAADLHGDDRTRDEQYLEQIGRRVWQLDDASLERLVRIRSWVAPFLERCVAAPWWADTDVVGFTSTFQQNVASLALARRLRDRYPHLVIMMGGANWEGPMGVALHEQCPYVDVVVSGEADETFPRLLDTIAERGASAEALAEVAGVVARSGDGRTVSTGAARLIEDLDALPFATFEGFLDAFAASTAANELSVTPLLETSRGCWWGAHTHCTFCGLNGGTLAYRSKSPDRAFDELAALVDRFGPTRIGFVDNILDMRYFRTFLPRVAEELPGLNMFYEVKASLSNKQLALLARAGVSEIQPGIESLSDHVLELLRKGMTALRNVQLLKWCAEHGVKADWNILYGAPGETDEDHADVIRVIDAIGHLEPPTACGPIRFDRFSPYHDHPADYGIEAMRPMAPYRYLYPWPDEVLERVAYYFELPAVEQQHNEVRAAALRRRVLQWQEGTRGELRQIMSEPDRVLVIDTRFGEMVRHELTGWQAEVYLACDAVTELSDVVSLPGVRDVPRSELVAFLDRCVAARILLVRERRALSLAVRTPAREHADEQRPRTGRRLALIGAGAAV